MSASAHPAPARSESAERTPRILVIRRRYLGDLVLLGPVFRNLRQHWPQARLTVLVEAPYAGVPALNPDIDATLLLPRSLAEWPRLLRALRAGRFTHVLDFDNTDKTALLTRFTGASIRATLELQNVRRHFPSCYTATVFIPSPDYSAQSITETHLRLLAAAGVPVVTREMRLVPRKADLEFARGLLAGAKTQNFAGETGRTSHGRGKAGPNSGPPTLLVHPGSRSVYRRWPPERFGHVCRRVRQELGANAVLIGGPGEKALLQQIATSAGDDLSVIDQELSVPQLAAAAAQCDLLLCHDSGPMHLAAAVGTPVVALYGSQNATVWRPPGDRHTILQPPLPCRDCVAPDACVPGDSYRNYCVRNISEEQVFAAIRDQLARTTERP